MVKYFLGVSSSENNLSHFSPGVMLGESPEATPLKVLIIKDLKNLHLRLRNP